MNSETRKPQASKDGNLRITPHIPIRNIVTIVVIAFFVISFFSGLTYKFYASFLFLFYSWVNRMWIAVVMLGLFQVVLMIPLRIVNLKISNHIDEFKEKTEELKSQVKQTFYVQQNIRKGNRPLLFYTVDFVIQITSYLTIGRLFLTDFYSAKISSSRLFSFVPYPEYPIQSTVFKIPYIKFAQTRDLGITSVLIAWTIIVIFQLAIMLYRYSRRRQLEAARGSTESTSGENPLDQYKKYGRYLIGNSIILIVISWFLLRNFPTQASLGIFSGDISIPNRRFNTITAIATGSLLLWFGSNKIKRKTKLARSQNVSPDIINKTQKDMFKGTIRGSILVGLGAFFITNHIPSAFELSIFTLEIVAFLSPFTLDKLIIKTTSQQPNLIPLDEKIDSEHQKPKKKK